MCDAVCCCLLLLCVAALRGYCRLLMFNAAVDDAVVAAGYCLLFSVVLVLLVCVVACRCYCL